MQLQKDVKNITNETAKFQNCIHNIVSFMLKDIIHIYAIIYIENFWKISEKSYFCGEGIDSEMAGDESRGLGVSKKFEKMLTFVFHPSSLFFFSMKIDILAL